MVLRKGLCHRTGPGPGRHVESQLDLFTFETWDDLG